MADSTLEERFQEAFRKPRNEKAIGALALLEKATGLTESEIVSIKLRLREAREKMRAATKRPMDDSDVEESLIDAYKNCRHHYLSESDTLQRFEPSDVELGKDGRFINDSLLTTNQELTFLTRIKWLSGISNRDDVAVAEDLVDAFQAKESTRLVRQGPADDLPTNKLSKYVNKDGEEIARNAQGLSGIVDDEGWKRMARRKHYDSDSTKKP